MRRLPTVTDYISHTEATQILKVNRATLWRWVRDGKITSTTLMGRPAFLRTEVEELKKTRRGS